MKKMIVAIMLMAGFAIADDWYMPVYGTWTNTSAVWTNTLGNPVILKDIIVGAGASNQTFSVDLICNSAAITNRLIQSVVVGPSTNTSPTEMYVVLQAGDVIKFNSTPIDQTGKNCYSLYFLKNK